MPLHILRYKVSLYSHLNVSFSKLSRQYYSLKIFWPMIYIILYTLTKLMTSKNRKLSRFTLGFLFNTHLSNFVFQIINQTTLISIITNLWFLIERPEISLKNIVILPLCVCTFFLLFCTFSCLWYPTTPLPAFSSFLIFFLSSFHLLVIQ